MKSKGKQKEKSAGKKTGASWQTRAIIILFVCTFGLYLASRLMLNSYNASLAQTNTALVDEINQTTEEISTLQSEVNILQDKTSVLGMLDYQVSDNQNNIYVIDQN